MIHDLFLIEANRIQSKISKKELCEDILSVKSYDNMLLKLPKNKKDIIKKLKLRLKIKNISEIKYDELKLKLDKFHYLIEYRNMKSKQDIEKKYLSLIKKEKEYFSSNELIASYLLITLDYTVHFYSNKTYEDKIELLEFLFPYISNYNKVYFYDLKAFFYFDKDILKYEQIRLEGIEFAENNNVLFPRIYYYMGHSYLHRIDYFRSLKYLDKAFEQFVLDANFINAMYILYYKSVFLRRIHRHNDAIMNLLKIVSDNKSLDYKYLYYRVYNELGLNYTYLEDYQKAYHYFELGLKSKTPMSYYYNTLESNLCANLVNAYKHIASKEDYNKKLNDIRAYIKSVNNVFYEITFELELDNYNDEMHEFVLEKLNEIINDYENNEPKIMFIKNMIRKLIDVKNYKYAAIYQEKLNELT